MDKKSNVLGKAGAVGFALGVFGFISLLITISFLQQQEIMDGFMVQIMII